MRNESKRQELARRLIEREIYYCVSGLVTELSTLVMNAPHGITDTDWDTDIRPLMESTNYEEAGTNHINSCDDLFDLEQMAEHESYWSEAIAATGYDENTEYEDDDDDPVTATFDEWYEDRIDDEGREKALKAIRDFIVDHTSDWEDFCREFDVDLDDYHSEVYEHWIVSTHLANLLESKGETVGELCGLTIWGRTTTGQSICLDHVIQEIAQEIYSDST